MIRRVAPLWYAEQKMIQDEETRLEAGAEARDLSSYTDWRLTTDACVLSTLDFYGAYLVGQTIGLSDSLDLSALVAAADIEQIAPDDRVELARMVLIAHGEIMELARMEQRKQGFANG